MNRFAWIWICFAADADIDLEISVWPLFPTVVVLCRPYLALVVLCPEDLPGYLLCLSSCFLVVVLFPLFRPWPLFRAITTVAEARDDVFTMLCVSSFARCNVININ